MQMKALLCVVALSFAAAGCAGVPHASTEPQADRGEIVTGSNIPRKSKQAGAQKVDEISKEEFERSRIHTLPPQAPGGASRGGA